MIVPLPIRAAFAVVALAASDVAQGPVAVKELSAEELARQRVRFQKDADGKITIVHWGEHQVPLKIANSECVVGQAPGSEDLVILAGGVRTSLVLYLVQSDGDFEPYETGGGRQQPRLFNGGCGSWPWIEGRHLVFFAYKKDAAVEFRVLDFAGHTIATRSVVAGIDGFQVRSDADQDRVEVEFGAKIEKLSIPHPLAPRLKAIEGVDFGDVLIGTRSRRVVELRNTGRRPFVLHRVEPPIKAIGLDERPPKTIEPGQLVRLRLYYSPTAEESLDARLRIITTPAVRDSVVLRGRGVAPKSSGTPVVGPGSKEVPATSGDGDIAKSDEDAKPAVEKETGKAAATDAPPAVPQVAEFTIHPRGGGRVYVRGRLAEPSPSHVVVRNSVGKEARCAVGPDGRFHTRLSAGLGRGLRLCASDRSGRKSEFVSFGTVPPMLALDGAEIVVRCLPAESFLLTVRCAGEDLRSWRSTTDSMGGRRLPISILGRPAAENLKLTLEVRVVDGGTVRASREVPVR